MLRIPPEVHGAALAAAQAAGTSLNQWAARVLKEAQAAGTSLNQWAAKVLKEAAVER